MKKLSLLGLAYALALPLVAARPGAAAETPVVDRAVGDRKPFVLTWIDTADNKLGLDDKFAAQIANLIAGATYLFTDKGPMLVAQLQGQELKPVVPPINEIHSQDRNVFVGHVRTPDRTLFLDGMVFRSDQDRSKGFARWNLLLIGKGGSSATSLIGQELTFQSGNGNPQPNPPPVNSLVPGRG